MDSTLPNPVGAIIRSELRYQVSRIAILLIAFLFPLFMIVTVAFTEGGIELDDLIPITVMLVMFGGMPGFFLLYMQQEAFSIEKRGNLFGVLPVNEATQYQALFRLTLIELLPSLLITLVTVTAMHLINPEIPLLYGPGIASLISLGVLLAILIQSSIRTRSTSIAQVFVFVGIFAFILSLNFIRYLGLDWIQLVSQPWLPIVVLALLVFLARMQARLILTPSSRT
ncbi:hypothetical protein KQI63_09460 [bacterium]|nr:hypothetical protein [bacterium]